MIPKYNSDQYLFLLNTNKSLIYLYFIKYLLRQIGAYKHYVLKLRNKIMICSQNFISLTKILSKKTTNKTERVVVV